MSEQEAISREALLKKLMEASFAAHEANLYLDGHPTDKDALLYFQKESDACRRLTDAYEEEYGPITAYGDGYHDDWQWVKTPFPWEMEA